MTDKEKISWRQQAKLWVLQGILLVGAGISLFSTMEGFHTVFFPASAVIACAASLLVQGIELACAERFNLAGCAAFLLSVAFSAMSFINIGTPTSVYMRHAMTTLNSAYSTQLLPDVQSAISSDMGSLYSTISGELTALRTEAQATQEQNTVSNMLTEADYALIRSRYNEAQKKQTEYFELDQLIKFLQDHDLEGAYALMDAIEAEEGSGSTLKKLKADVRSLRIRLQALNADAATTAEESAHAIQLLLAQASVDTSALSEQTDKLITAALNAGLKTDPLPLRDHLERYLQLAELNRTITEHVSAEAAFLENVEQAAAGPDADAAWQQVKALWSHELSSLRTALAGSVLSTRTKHMGTTDALTWQILEGDRTLVQKAITMLWYNHDLTSFAACVLAFMLDGISIYCIHAACEIRRQIAQSSASSAKTESAA
jgi:hypothetical protein